jgi:hypothetical protein
MKLPLLCLGMFVLGVFVGAQMWLALIFCAALAAMWWFGLPSSASRRLAHHAKSFGRGIRDLGH